MASKIIWRLISEENFLGVAATAISITNKSALLLLMKMH